MCNCSCVIHLFDWDCQNGSLYILLLYYTLNETVNASGAQSCTKGPNILGTGWRVMLSTSQVDSILCSGCQHISITTAVSNTLNNTPELIIPAMLNCYSRLHPLKKRAIFAISANKLAFWSSLYVLATEILASGNTYLNKMFYNLLCTQQYFLRCSF